MIVIPVIAILLELVIAWKLTRLYRGLLAVQADMQERHELRELRELLELLELLELEGQD